MCSRNHFKTANNFHPRHTFLQVNFHLLAYSVMFIKIICFSMQMSFLTKLLLNEIFIPDCDPFINSQLFIVLLPALVHVTCSIHIGRDNLHNILNIVLFF